MTQVNKQSDCGHRKEVTHMKKTTIAIMTVFALTLAVVGVFNQAPTTHMADPEDRG